jgi:hypothetical protein
VVPKEVWVYALCGSFLTNIPPPKSPYGSVKMIVYFDIINLVGSYMVVNEIKCPYEQ